MTICKHLGWVRVTSEKEVALVDSGRMSRVVGQLTNPATQQPLVLLFVGRRAKNVALRELFPNQIKKGYNEGIAALRVDNTSLYSNHPVLFAESDPYAAVLSEVNTSCCHETWSFPVRWAKAATVHNIYDILHARLFCPFTDVLCIFADDFPDLKSVVSYLKSWATHGDRSNMFKQARLSVVIVKRGCQASPSPTYDLLEIQDIQFSLDQKTLKDFYSSIKVLHLADEQISPLARVRRLKELLWRQMDEVRKVKMRNGCLYSALHLDNFFQMAVSHTAASVVQPFNFITASRRGNEISSDHADHIGSFLRLGTQCSVSVDAIAAFIASSILLDAHPTKMHLFNPRTVYDVIYRSSCFKALVSSFKERSFPESETAKLAVDQEQCIKGHFIASFEEMVLSGKTAAQMHQEKTRGLDITWSQIRSNVTCFWCLRRKPENTLSCEHAICNVCVRIYGDEMPIFECQYNIETCLLCHSGNHIVRLKPLSAGERVLSVDGGGTRGVIPLEIMAIIQNIMGAKLQFQDLFDIAFGTSVGGLIVCILFLRGISVISCVQIFDVLARKLFERPPGQMNPIRRLRLFLRGWYRDGHYDANALEDRLKENFGSIAHMFGHQPGVLATKVGVIAATIGNASPVIFTNYNGSGAGKKQNGYLHVRPEKIEDEPCIWEACRGTSAAPVLYRSVEIKASGPVQDGGMSGHNNPVRIALSERLRNDPSLITPDIVVSLGTGSSSPKVTDFRHVILDGYAPRLWRSYMSSFDGQKIWEELMSSVDETNRERYIRLNLLLPRKEPAIDNTDRMDEMRKLVHQPEILQHCKKTLYASIIAAFYFELRSIPERVREGRYHCRGTIRSRLPGDGVVKVLPQCNTSYLTFVTDAETLGYYQGDRDLCALCHRYQKNIDFFVHHETEVVTIYVQSTQGRRKISAFPQHMQWFKEKQELEAPFGTVYHKDLQHRSCKSCIPNATPKRQMSDDQGRFQRDKKRRLQLRSTRSLSNIPEETG